MMNLLERAGMPVTKVSYIKKKKGTTPMTYTAIVFVFSLAIMLAIFNSSGSQFNAIQGGTTVTSTNNIIIGQNGASQLASNQLQFNGSIGSTTCVFTNIAGQIYCQLIVLNNQIQSFGCNLANSIGLPTWLSSCSSSLSASGSPLGKKVQQFVGNQLGANVQSTSVSNNQLLQIIANPFNQAMIVMGTFLALGIAAGLFGAGILARVMVLAGLSLSMVLYIEGQLGTFAGSGMPTYLWWIINGIMTVVMIIIIREAFDSGGVG